MFESHESAWIAVAEDRIWITDTIFCSAEIFRIATQTKVGCKPEANTLTSVNCMAPLTPESSLLLTTKLVREIKKKVATALIHRIMKIRSRSQESIPICNDRRIRYGTTRRTRSHDHSVIAASYVSYEINQYLTDGCSSVKPTAKLYRTIREENAQYLAAFELKNAWSSKNNTKFRTARTRHRSNLVQIGRNQIADSISIA